MTTHNSGQSHVVSTSVFVRRCRVCGHEIETPWGPKVHYESGQALRAHVLAHSATDLMSFALREHFTREPRA